MEERRLGIWEKYLTLWVALCIAAGTLLGRAFPGISDTLAELEVAHISIPIAICLFAMIYPIMVQISFEEIKKASRNPRPIILTLVDTGVRASELCSITIADVDKRNKRIFIWGKGAKERIVYIDASTARAIWRYLTIRPDARPDDPLFVTREGRPLNRHSVRLLIGRLGRRAGIPNANVHRFRHTFAINFLRNGGNAYTLQRLLGHSTLKMVKTYLALAAQDDSDNHRRASPVANWHL